MRFPNFPPFVARRPYGAAGMIAAMLLLCLVTLHVSAGEAVPFRMPDTPETARGTEGIRLLGALDLSSFTTSHNNFAELSGLAWDNDAGVLYAVSDRGVLFALRPAFSAGRLDKVELLGSAALLDPRGRRLRGKHADSEGLVGLHTNNGIANDTLLAVAFERVPRVQVHKPDGTFVRNAAMAPALANAEVYHSPNKGREAIMELPAHGLVVGTEWPLKAGQRHLHQLFAANGASAVIPRLDETNAGLVALEALPDGGFIVVERAHSWLTLSLVVNISRIAPWPADSDAGIALTKHRVARLDSSLGWYVDNFEGLARHRGNRFFLISDDNGSALQKTLLLYFELL